MDSATITIFVLIIGCYAFIAKFIIQDRKGVSKMDFEKHKESVQYKDNCSEIVKRQDERHKEIREDLKEIKQLIRNGGKD